MLLASGQQLGENVVVNGDFASDNLWTKGTGWTISGGKANKAAGGGSLSQVFGAISSGTYRVTYTISNWGGSGSIAVAITGSGPSEIGTSRSANGTYTEDLTVSAPDGIEFNPATGAETCSIDNVLLQRKFS